MAINWRKLNEVQYVKILERASRKILKSVRVVRKLLRTSLLLLLVTHKKITLEMHDHNHSPVKRTSFVQLFRALKFEPSYQKLNQSIIQQIFYKQLVMNVMH